MKKGDSVIIKKGASEWMKDRGFWIDRMGESVDDKIGVLDRDHTSFNGDESHWGVNLGLEFIIGVHPQFLKLTN